MFSHFCKKMPTKINININGKVAQMSSNTGSCMGARVNAPICGAPMAVILQISSVHCCSLGSTLIIPQPQHFVHLTPFLVLSFRFGDLMLNWIRYFLCWCSLIGYMVVVKAKIAEDDNIELLGLFIEQRILCIIAC